MGLLCLWDELGEGRNALFHGRERRNAGEFQCMELRAAQTKLSRCCSEEWHTPFLSCSVFSLAQAQLSRYQWEARPSNLRKTSKGESPSKHIVCIDFRAALTEQPRPSPFGVHCPLTFPTSVSSAVEINKTRGKAFCCCFPPHSPALFPIPPISIGLLEQRLPGAPCADGLGCIPAHNGL